ncbi:phage major capsid protein [Paenibacillus lautus]|uniref:phage major capsid protein n=1 Tax=Paenibacillus lautus TaxID=1401 RepID=UPI003D287523
MNKKKLLELIAKKEARKAELLTNSKTTEIAAELRSINSEMESLNGEIAELRAIADTLPDEDQAPAAAGNPEVVISSQQPVGRSQVLGTYGMGTGAVAGEEKREKDMSKKFEQRGADLKSKKSVTFELDEMPELRAVNIGGGKLVVEKKYSNTLNETFNDVSGVIDTVNAVPLQGGESYEKGFVKNYGEGDYTSETGDYAETDPVFDYVNIGKAKITAYSEMTDESQKLPNVDYQAYVRKNMVTALRKKISKQIIAGPGTANTLTGIFKAPENVIPTSSDLEIGEIDETTLDKIVFGYGGEEDVEGGAYLFLNKKDLAAFASLRNPDGKKIYKISLNGNSGTISSDESYQVKFIINSACPALSDVGTVVDTYCMAYGMPAVYEMPIFSAVEVQESRDYKFRSGQIAYRGSVWIGGNVAGYKGFVRIKKGVTT